MNIECPVGICSPYLVHGMGTSTMTRLLVLLSVLLGDARAGVSGVLTFFCSPSTYMCG